MKNFPPKLITFLHLRQRNKKNYLQPKTLSFIEINDMPLTFSVTVS